MSKTYKAEHNGQTVRVTIPENDDRPLFMAGEDVVFDAIQEHLSPRAVACIVAFLQSARSNDEDTDCQVTWFADGLVEMLGGNVQARRLMREIGL